VQSPHSRPLTRRALLGATGVAVLAALAGCNPFSSAPATITVTAPTTTALPPQTPTVLLGLLFTTRLHVANLKAAIAVDKRDAALLTLLLKDRTAHLAALEKEYARRFGTPPAPETAAPATTAAQSDDPDEVIGRIRGDASTAQNKFTDALSGASRFQAQLYGSIAACVATHRMVLA
jgi:hypothetical protein